MDGTEEFRLPTSTRPGTEARMSIYAQRRDAELPIEMTGDLRLSDILAKESQLNARCIDGKDDETYELVDFSVNTKRKC